MELYFKQRLLSFFDSFDIYDEDDNVVYTVEGQPAWLHKLHVLNAAGEHIATVRQELRAPGGRAEHRLRGAELLSAALVVHAGLL